MGVDIEGSITIEVNLKLTVWMPFVIDKGFLVGIDERYPGRATLFEHCF